MMDAPKFMWAYLARFGTKLWQSWAHIHALPFERSMWNEMTDRLAERGLNVLVWDLAEGMVFPSHPELAVKGSWEPEAVKEEIARLARMGILSVPKLNFSSSHDHWLGKWRDYLSTPEYFGVCREVIGDVVSVFGGSPFFHLGYDEESYFIQNINKFPIVRLRRGDLWWNDFLWFVDEVRGHGMRPWIWSDYCWHHKEEFLGRMPKDVLQSNWYYGRELDPAKLSEKTRPEVETYETLEKAHFDQMPCGSTYSCDSNFGSTVERCRRIVAPERLKGFFMAAWAGTMESYNRGKILKAIDVAGEEIRKWGRT